MIRNVVVGRLLPDVSAEQVETALQALRDLRVEGVELRMVSGVDLGLREGNASYAITVDLDDEDAYRVYDRDEEHNRIRRELFAPISASIERIQFRLPG
ncbi:Dabb family protein [Pseudonocardia petroleophila]|uniref:Dabb family protein n=1 Tax=Pseudonocardia petroleophila TaxID=37331 RepID=A0A7G7MKP4_9PSEU|nr:Dabb family protein [Pseudonocardia petroleophila]QNG53355.1 Dabb family protein [Pseudonocardia petroleophila]